MKQTGKSSESSDELPEDADFKQQFGELPLNKKLTTLIQLEAATMSDAVNTILDKSIAAGENVIDKLTGRVGDKK